MISILPARFFHLSLKYQAADLATEYRASNSLCREVLLSRMCLLLSSMNTQKLWNYCNWNVKGMTDAYSKFSGSALHIFHILRIARDIYQSILNIYLFSKSFKFSQNRHKNGAWKYVCWSGTIFGPNLSFFMYWMISIFERWIFNFSLFSSHVFWLACPAHHILSIPHLWASTISRTTSHSFQHVFLKMLLWLRVWAMDWRVQATFLPKPHTSLGLHRR
jgi:hypothetical protein